MHGPEHFRCKSCKFECDYDKDGSAIFFTCRVLSLVAKKNDLSYYLAIIRRKHISRPRLFFAVFE
jgi:hypothetical protein